MEVFLTPSLVEYVNAFVLPRYHSFDAAHQVGHAETVIDNALYLAKYYAEVRTDCVFLAAAYHDLGLTAGRETHHLVSGAMLRQDVRLREWFSSEEIELMAQAVEDHRASAKSAPRSLLGRIIAEADRDINPEKILLRTVQYGLSHYPELTKQQHFERFIQHLNEKYARGGYLSLWLPESKNAEKLERLRCMIDDEDALRSFFEKYWKECTDM